jgi:hypothetical protein
MAFSYSALNNYGKAILPSVEGGFGSMNILKDPPKSIHTRRINKVGETSSITQMIDDSSNRSCENIQEYARGVNPFVSVSYSNEGNNGGQRSGGLTVSNQGKHAYLPYTIMKDGVFRPPVLRQEQLLPLSRLPRVWTTAFTNPEFPDFSKKMRDCGTAQTTKEVRNTTLSVCARPTAVYNIETPISEPFEVRYVIQNPNRVSTTSGIRTMDGTTQNVLEPVKGVDYNMRNTHAVSGLSSFTDRTTQHVQNPSKGVDYDPLHAHAMANKGDVKHIDNNNFDTDRYMQETRYNNVSSKIGASHMQITSLEDIFDMSNIKTQDIVGNPYATKFSGNEQTKYIHEDINLTRRLPHHQATSNVRKNIHKRNIYKNNIELTRNTPLTQALSNPGTVQKGQTDNSSRSYKLQPRINPGGYEGRGTRPSQKRMQETIETFESQKSKLDRIVNQQLEGRYKSFQPQR